MVNQKSFYHSNRLQWLISSLLMLALSMSSFSVGAVEIQATTDRDPVNLNESFQLTYEATESVDDDPDFSVLKPYLDILSQSQSSNYSIVNGRSSSSKSWNLTVMATKAGKLNLPPVPFGSDKSQALSLQVNKAASQSTAASEDFFTRVRISSQKIYVQQELIVTQSMFSSKNLSAYSLGDLDFNGADVVALQLGDEKQYKTRIGNRAYLVIEKRYAIYPQVAGPLTLSPTMAEARTASSSNSFFDPFGRSGKVVRAHSDEQRLNVLPIPLEANMSPWLPAKSLELEESWADNPPQFTQGEPLTRTISIKAEGLTAAQLPELPEYDIGDLKQYPDQPLIKDVNNDTGITGYRTEKIALIPTVAGKVSLPAIEIPWWNTQTQSRQMATIPARIIDVRPAIAGNGTLPPVTSAVPKVVESPVVEKQVQPENPNQQLIEIEPQSEHWKFLALAFGLAWVMTLLIWFFKSRKQSGENPGQLDAMNVQSLSVKQALTALQSACSARNSAQCRSALIQWAQTLFEQQDIQSMKSVMLHVSQRMAAEIEKIDIALYAQNPDVQRRIIDYDLIASEARQVTRDHQKHSSDEKGSILEPMYK